MTNLLTPRAGHMYLPYSRVVNAAASKTPSTETDSERQQTFTLRPGLLLVLGAQSGAGVSF